MRHKKKTPKLSLKSGPRKALLRSLATNLVMHGKIKTTLAKAKALRPVIEKHVTASKLDTLAVRRRLIAYLYKENAVKKMIKEIGPKYKDRKGGYTRIIKLANRKGDDASMAIIEFV